jgi:malonate transporter and related proteins
MNEAVLLNLAGVLLMAAIGFGVARAGWLNVGTPDSDASRVLGNATLYLFIPALLFQAAYRLDLNTMPWRMVAAFLLPALAWLLGWYVVHRVRVRKQAAPHPAAGVAQAITVTYGNSVQLGIPFAAAVFGSEGLGLHLTLVGLHGLVLLTALTALAEWDVARSQAGEHHPRGKSSSWAAQVRTVGMTLRNTLLHPVLVPLIVGLVWQTLGLPLPKLARYVIEQIASAAVPLCLVLIGVSLAQEGVRGHLRGALRLTVAKLVVMPAWVLLAGHYVFGLSGLPLQVITMMAALPVGTNALIFAQRYGVMQAQATAAIVVSTLAFVLTSVAWLAVLARWP